MTAVNVDKIVAWAEKMGAREAEAFFSSAESAYVLFEKKSITLSERRRSSGYGVRVVVEKPDGKSVGFAYSNDPSADALKSAIDRALGVARSKPVDADLVQLQQPSPIHPERTIFDSEILEKDPAEILDFVQCIIDTADSSEKIRTVSGSLSLLKSETSISNSHGVSGRYEASNFDVGVYATSEDGESVGVGWDRFSAYRVDEASALGCAQEASDLSVSQLHPKRVRSGRFPLLICPEGFTQILSNTLVPEINSENVFNGDSPLCDKTADPVGSEILTVYDDGTVREGIGSKPFDDEGCTVQRTDIVVKGVLKNFLHNSYTSNRLGVPNTGNSYRSGGRLGASRYLSEPSIAPANLVVEAGNRDREDLIHQLDEAIIVKGFIGAHTANSKTGEFSLALHCASKIEKGDLAYPIREAVVGGSILTILSNLSEIGNDSKQVPVGSRTAIISPSCVVEGLAISG